MIVPNKDLVFDVGMHQGEDSAYYLMQGYRVVAFEANPDLVERGRERFAAAIAAKAMTIVSGAIADTDAATIAFYRHPTKSVWGTTDPEWADRNEGRGQSLRVDVPVVKFGEEIERHGMPTYLKIDIEGADRHCLETLRQFDTRPDTLSLESEKKQWRALVDEFDLFESLGYRKFAVVQQEGLSWRSIPVTNCQGQRSSHRFESHASGPFGQDVGPWLSRDDALARYRRIFAAYQRFGDDSWLHRHKPTWAALKLAGRALRRPIPGWYDTHAALA
jgi:FkbM family methyltransferase